MTWLAVVWGSDAEAIATLGPDVTVRRPVHEQGFYANPQQFDAFLSGVRPMDFPSLGARVWAWRVEEHSPKVGDDRCAVAMVSLMRRNPEMDHEGFTHHWTERHAPLAQRRHVGLHDYRQYVVVDPLTAGAPEIDGIAVLGFRTRSDFDERFFDSDEGRDEIMADVARFMDRPGRETTLVGPPVPSDRSDPSG